MCAHCEDHANCPEDIAMRERILREVFGSSRPDWVAVIERQVVEAVLTGRRGTPIGRHIN